MAARSITSVLCGYGSTTMGYGAFKKNISSMPLCIPGTITLITLVALVISAHGGKKVSTYVI